MFSVSLKSSVFIPIPKKGNAKECSNYRTIALISHVSKVMLKILPAILIPACASSSPAFLMMYSAYKLNKQSDNIQPRRTPFPIWNQSVVPCPVLIVTF